MIYDPVNWTVLQNVNLPINDSGVAGGTACRRITIGRYDNHQNLASVGSFHWIDNFVIDDTGANFPMFPGSVWMADSTSKTDALAAYTAAAAGGETVVLPNGTASWASGLTLSKSLLRLTSINGSNSTIINGTWAGTGNNIANENVINAAGIEVDGIRWTVPNESEASGIHNRIFTVDFGGNYFRFHDCQFINGMIFVADPFGSIYKCAFQGGDYCMRIQGVSASGQHYTCCFPWDSTSTNLVAIENCEFAASPGQSATSPLILSTQQGGIWMIRHCHGRFTGSGGSPDMGNMIDFHGPISGGRGSIGAILASNRFEFSGVGLNYVMDQRGGTALNYSNVMTGIAAAKTRLRIAGPKSTTDHQDEPEYYQNGGVEQITNTYFFANTSDGFDLAPDIGDGDPCSCAQWVDTDRITLGQSYFLNAPSALLVPPYPFPGRHDAIQSPTGGGGGPTPSPGRVTHGKIGRANAIGGPP
jgi:hypothetical protein